MANFNIQEVAEERAHPSAEAYRDIYLARKGKDVIEEVVG